MSIELPEVLKSLTAEGWTAVAAFLALGISGSSAIWRAVRLVLELRRADIQIELAGSEDARPGMGYFCVSNDGPAVARDVVIEFHIDPKANEAEPVFGSNTSLPFPIARVLPGASLRIPTVMTISVPSYFELSLTWKDGRRKPQSKRFQVTRP